MKQIILGMERWNFVGEVSRDGDQVVISAAYNIRRWGTERGLGQLALDGPTSDTILDHYGTVRIHVLAVAGFVDCDSTAKNWVKHDKQHAKEHSK